MRGSESVALLFPVVGVVVLAVALREAGLIRGEELDAAQPLGALPEVARRDDETQRPAVLGLELLAVRLPGDESLVVLERLERHVGREALLRVREHVAGARLRSDELRELAPVHALERRVEAAPARDAVDVRRDLRLRQCLQLVVAKRDRLLDLAEDLEVPRGELGLRNGAGVEDGPLLGQVLARREPGGVEPLVAQLLLRFRPEEGHAYLD